VSAVTGEGVEALREAIIGMVRHDGDAADPYPFESAQAAPQTVQG
jgi:hypothetical protein